MRVTVRKRNLRQEVVWAYEGVLRWQTEQAVCLEARFDRPDRPFLDITLRLGDRFVETFFSNRWYNVFEIYDVETGSLKGWYCNLARPMVWDEPGALSYVDLALDVWVSPLGRQQVLDEEEFAALPLAAPERALVRRWLKRLQRSFRRGALGNLQKACR